MKDLNNLYAIFDSDLNLSDNEVQGTQYCVERSRDKGTDSQKECKDNDRTSILGSIPNNEENINDIDIDISF